MDRGWPAFTPPELSGEEWADCLASIRTVGRGEEGVTGSGKNLSFVLASTLGVDKADAVIHGQPAPRQIGSLRPGPHADHAELPSEPTKTLGNGSLRVNEQ